MQLLCKRFATGGRSSASTERETGVRGEHEHEEEEEERRLSMATERLAEPGHREIIGLRLMDGITDGWIDGWMDGWMDELVAGWLEDRMNELMAG